MKTFYNLALVYLLALNSSYGQYYATTVKTPLNLTVDALQFSGADYNSSEITYWNNQWTGNWNVEILENSTRYYNCHGYAWHKVDGGNTVWINDIDEQTYNPNDNVRTKYYIGSNPTYVEVSSNYREGLKVSYFPRDHSAVTTSDPNKLISKWANGPLVRHSVSETDFYSGSQIKYYEVALSGSQVLCTSSSQQYSTLNISGATYNWNGNNISVSGSGNTISATASGNNGSTTLFADVFSPYSSTTVKARKTVWLGSPNLVKKINGVATGTTPVSAGSLYYLEASSSSPNTSFNYNDYDGSGNLSISIYSPNSANTNMYVSSNSTSGNRKVKVTAANGCGSYNEDFVFYLYSGYRSYPNPAKDNLTVEFTNTEDQMTLPDELEIVSEKEAKTVRKVSLKEVHEKKMFREGNKVDFDIHDLPRGTYYLKVKNSRLEESKRTETIRLVFE